MERGEKRVENGEIIPGTVQREGFLHRVQLLAGLSAWRSLFAPIVGLGLP